MSFYLTIFVISDNEATRHILKLALLPQVDRALGRLLPWLCLEKCSLKCRNAVYGKWPEPLQHAQIAPFSGESTHCLSPQGPGGDLDSCFMAVLSSWLLQGMICGEVLSIATSLRHKEGPLGPWKYSEPPAGREEKEVGGSCHTLCSVLANLLVAEVCSFSWATDLSASMAQSKVRVTFWSPQEFVGHKGPPSK